MPVDSGWITLAPVGPLFFERLPVGLLFRRTIAPRNAFFLGVLRRRGLDHRAHDRLVGRDPIGEHLPLASVPLLKLDRAAALVVHAGNLERLHEADCAELLQALVVDVEVLQSPAHLLAGHRLTLAEALLRLAYRLGGQDAPQHAAVVVDRAEARLVLELALPLRVNVLLDLANDYVIRAGCVEACGDLALV